MMRTPPPTEIQAPIFKVVSAWIVALLADPMLFFWHAFNETPWDKLAQFAAFVYSLCLIYEYLRKKFRNGTKQDIA